MPLDTVWQEGTLHQVPYWVFQRADVLAREQETVFRGACWHYLCLEAEIPNAAVLLLRFRLLNLNSLQQVHLTISFLRRPIRHAEI